MTHTLKTIDQVVCLRVADTNVRAAFDYLERAFDGLELYDDSQLLAAYEHAYAMLDRFQGYVGATVQLHDTERPD